MNNKVCINLNKLQERFNNDVVGTIGDFKKVFYE